MVNVEVGVDVVTELDHGWAVELANILSLIELSGVLEKVSGSLTVPRAKFVQSIQIKFNVLVLPLHPLNLPILELSNVYRCQPRRIIKPVIIISKRLVYLVAFSLLAVQQLCHQLRLFVQDIKLSRLVIILHVLEAFFSIFSHQFSFHFFNFGN